MGVKIFFSPHIDTNTQQRALHASFSDMFFPVCGGAGAAELPPLTRLMLACRSICSVLEASSGTNPTCARLSRRVNTICSQRLGHHIACPASHRSVPSARCPKSDNAKVLKEVKEYDCASAESDELKKPAEVHWTVPHTISKYHGTL